MIKEIMSQISKMNVNSDNIILILTIASLAIAVIVKIYIEVKKVAIKALRIASVVIGIVLIIGIQQGLLEQWVTKLTAYIK